MSSRGTTTGDASNPSTVEEAFELIERALDFLTAGPWWQLSSEEVAAAAARLHAIESRVAFAQIAVIGEAVTRGLPAEAGAKDGAGWLRALIPITPGQAFARAGLAQALHQPGELAPVRDHLAAGTISPAHAGVVVRTNHALEHQPEPVDATTRAEVQELLLHTAAEVDPAQLGRAGQRARHRLNPDAAQRLAKDEDAQHEARDAYLITESTGMVLLHALLPPTEGALLRAALDPLAAPHPATHDTPDARTKGKRTADALVALAGLALAARPGQPGSLPSRGGSPIRCHLTADLATLRADLARHGRQAGLTPATLDSSDPANPAGIDVSPLTAQTLACDAEITPILLDDDGRVLDVGTTTYPFPPRIRRAIEHRDRHCTFPSCAALPSWCDAHHLIRFPDGPTSEANGTLLCGRHHRYVHAHAWTGTIEGGYVVWRAHRRGDPDPATNAHLEIYERELHRLTQRWLTRRQQLHDTG